MLKGLKSSLANPGPVLPFLALVAATGFWGSSFLTVAEALSETDPFTLVFMRFFLGTLVLAAILRKTLRAIPSRTWKMGAVSGLVIYGSYLFNCAGLMTTMSSMAGFLTALYVLITPFLFWLIVGKRPDICAFLGSGTAFLGLVLLADPFSLSPETGLGEWMIILSAFLSALEIILMGRFAPYCKAAEICFTQLFFVALYSGIGSLAAHWAMPSLTPTVFSAGLMLAVLWLATILSCAQFLLAWGQKFVPPAQAAVIFSLESVFAAIIGWLAGERLGFWGFAGGGLIVAGILLTEWKRLLSSK